MSFTKFWLKHIQIIKILDRELKKVKEKIF